MSHRKNIQFDRGGGKEKLPFRVPDNYFEDLPLRIRDRLAASHEKKPIYRIPSFHSRMAVAAIFIGLLAIGYAGFRMISRQGADLFLSAEEKVEAIEYFGFDLDDDLLISAILDSEIGLSTSSDQSESDDLIKYLSQEEIDFSKLLSDF